MGGDFKARCYDDFRIQERHLIHFLDDDVMSAKYKMGEDDVESFEFFNEQSDVCSCLKYFSGVWNAIS